MIFESICGGIIIVSGWYNANLLSLAYLLIGFLLSLNRIFLPFSCKKLYKCSLLISLSYLTIKIYALLTDSRIFWLSDPNENIELYIGPDIAVLGSSTFCLLFIDKISPDDGQSYIRPIGFILLGFISTYYKSMTSFTYIICLTYYLTSNYFLSAPNIKRLSFLISLISTLHLSTPYLLFTNFLPLLSLPSNFEFLSISRWGILEMFLVFLIQIIFTSVTCSEKFSFSKNEPLLPHIQTSGTIDKIKYIFYYCMTLLGLWLWILVFNGPVGILLMYWMFSSILETNLSKTGKLTKFFLIPCLSSLLMFYYIFALIIDEGSIWNSFVSLEYFEVKMCLIVATIYFSGLFYKLCQRLPKKFEIFSKVRGSVLTLLFKQIYLFSLLVLFIVGLSDINLLHTGLMCLCIWFMLNPSARRTYWIVLVMYTMTILGIRYIWQVINDISQLKQHWAYQVIGLSQSETSLNSMIIPYDYLIWILLLSSSIQNVANNIKLQETNTYSFGLKIFLDTYNYFSHFEVWIMYCLLIIVQFLSQVNYLNLIRLLILILVLYNHLENYKNTIIKSYGQVYKFMVLLEVYCGILLAVRYIYQFLMFIPESKDLEFSSIGFMVYDKKELYTSTASDCTLLIVSVIASRNCYRFRPRDSSRSLNFREIKHKFFNKYFSRPFQYIPIILIFYISIFEILSISMLINLVSISFYSIYTVNYFTKVSISLEHKHKDREWTSRAVLWKILFLNTMICIIFSYARFLFGTNFEPYSWGAYLEWTFFLLGYTRSEDSQIVLVHSYLYIILLGILIIERHCLQYICPLSIQKQGEGWANFRYSKMKNSFDLQHETLKQHLDFVRVLNLFKAICEALVPMMFFLLAYEKLSIVSVFYVILVFLNFLTQNLTKIRFLFFALVFLTVLQYTFFVSNINEDTAKYFPSTKPPIAIPWFEDKSEQAVYFLNGQKHLQSVFLDMATMVFILAYYYYLSYREVQLLYLEELYAMYKNKNLNLTDIEGDKKKCSYVIKEALVLIKKAFYQFSRNIVVGIALLFITQSLGLLSAIYCIFCLVFIMKESSIYVTKSVDSYVNLLTWFLRFLVLDLTLQIFIQLPLVIEENTEFEAWCKYIGLLKLVNSNTKDPKTLESNYIIVLGKIYTFFIVFVINRMMKTKDYEEHINRVFCEMEKKAKNIAIEMTKQFNNERIKMNKFYSESKNRFDEQLNKIEENIQIWNFKYIKKKENLKKRRTLTPTYASPYTKSRTIVEENIEGVEIEQNIQKEKFKSRRNFTNDYANSYVKEENAELVENEKIIQKGFQFKLNSFLISLINPHLFSSFVESLSKSGICRPPFVQMPFHYRSPESSKPRVVLETIKSSSDDSCSDSDDSSDSSSDDPGLLSVSRRSNASVMTDVPVNFIDSFEKDEVEYNFECKDYFLIILYGIASNTEALVYISFFLNHWNYASMESIIFPLSVIGYAILEYPRPPPEYFKYMLIYTEVIFFLKFSLQLDISKEIIIKQYLSDYKDPYKIGFNLAENTYSKTLFYYILYDVIVMIALLLHNFYLLKVGLWDKTENEIESLKTAKESQGISAVMQAYIKSAPKKKSFLERLLPRNKEEKPGKDFYFFTIIIQMFIFIYIFCFFTRMDGNTQDISQALRSNQFQGRMVVSLMFQLSIIIAERYFYVSRTSQAFKDAQETEKVTQAIEKARNSIKTPTGRFRSSTAWGEEIKIRSTSFSVSNLSKGHFESVNPLTPTLNEDSRRLPMYFRLYIHISLLIIVHFVVFWYLPINGNQAAFGTYYCNIQEINELDRCNDFESNHFIQYFYLLYLIYLVFAGLQIKYSLPSFSKVTFPFMRSSEPMNYYIFKGYRSSPFLFEIRTLMDWIFTTTSLNLFQWFKFEDIYAQLFINECSQRSLNYKDHGDRVPKLEKCYMGVCGLLIILVIILLPLLIFSTLNPITELNPVISASLDVNFEYNGRRFNLYTIASADKLMNISEEAWNYEYEFTKIPSLISEDRNLMQKIVMPSDSDTIWTITPPGKRKLCDIVSEASESSEKQTLDANSTAKYTDAQIEVKYSFTRNFPIKNNEISLYKSKKIEKNALDYFNQVVCFDGTQTIHIPQFFFQIIRLPSNGETITPITVEHYDFISDLIMTLEEQNQYKWWNVSTLSHTNTSQGVIFFTISDEYSKITLNFSILTFYISVVYVLGALIKYATKGVSYNLVMTDMKDPKDLKIICEGVLVSRMIGNLKKEEELYFELLDILRSPEFTKMITGKSSIRAGNETKKDR